jgi:predicted short-subunit dehydrogenase-like oxidoreductase (DUF2520 family)
MRDAPSRAPWHCHKAAELIGVQVFHHLIEAVEASQIIFLTVPDSGIKKVVNSLAHFNLEGKYIVHTSGSQSIAVMENLRICGANLLAFHPLQSFADIAGAIKNLPGSLFTLEGDAGALALGKRLAKALKGKIFIIKPEDKVLYHLAACLTSNYLVTLFRLAYQVLDTIDFPAEHRQAFVKLAQGTLTNIKNLSPAEALTGPVARGDWETITSHLEALKAFPKILNLYKHLGKATLELAEDRIKPEQVQEMKELFESD